MAVTIKDIARKAGVSHTTVSRALLGNPLISLPTTEKIRKIARELGYRPSAAARSLKTNRSQVLGVIVSNIDDPYFSEVLQGIESTAQESGYSLFIAASQRDPDRERLIVQAMVEHRVEGVVICSSSFGAKQGRDFVDSGVPLVVVNNQGAEAYRYSIYHDDVAGSRELAAHLIALGHTRIGYLGNSLSGRTNQDRLAGYRAELKAAGLAAMPQYVYEVAYGQPGQVREALEHFLALHPRPTALLCYNDMMAIEVMSGLRQAGLRVPYDISITGFDNIIFSAYTDPPLTTFDQPKRFIGEEAGRLLLSLIGVGSGDGPPDEEHVRVLRGSLLVRLSTASPVPNS